MRFAPRLISGIAFALSACRGITSVDTPVRVSVAIDRADASIAVPVQITVRVVNRGAFPVQALDPRVYSCMQAFRVYDEAGGRVALPVRYCSAIGYLPVSLAPGDSLMVRNRWSGDTADANGRPTAVKAGLYRIVGYAFADTREVTSDTVVVSVR